MVVDMDSLVTADWLASALHEPDLIVLDCTVYLTMGNDGYVSDSGRSNFATGHIPGAGFADLIADLVDTTSPHSFVVPSPEHFAAAMERLGVTDQTRVVLYDDNNSMWAARVWLMLRWIGFDNAAMLDGGLKVWQRLGHALEPGELGPRSAAPGALTVTLRPALIADKEEMLASIDDNAVCLIDALPPAVFRGDVAPYARPGHLPGAINVAATAMIDRDTALFKPASEIRAMLPDRPEARTVVY